MNMGRGAGGAGSNFTTWKDLRPNSNCWLITVKKNSSNSAMPKNFLFDLGKNPSMFKWTTLQRFIHHIIACYNLRIWFLANSSWWAYVFPKRLHLGPPAGHSMSRLPTRTMTLQFSLPQCSLPCSVVWNYRAFNENVSRLPSIFLASF